MNLKELKEKKINELTTIAKEYKIEGASGMRRQDLIFSLLQAQSDQNGMIYGEGVLETLPDKTIILGVIDLEDMTVETPEQVAGRIRRAFPFAAPERIIVAPDCGMKYLPRDTAVAKLEAMVAGAAMVRAELAG